jgi:hypothetical protein
MHNLYRDQTPQIRLGLIVILIEEPGPGDKSAYDLFS